MFGRLKLWLSVAVVAVGVGGPARADETYKFLWYNGSSLLGAATSFTRDPSVTTTVTLSLYIAQNPLAANTPAPNRPDVFNSTGLYGMGFVLNGLSNTSSPVQVTSAAGIRTNSAFDGQGSTSVQNGSWTVFDSVGLNGPGGTLSPPVTSAAGVKLLKLADIDLTLVGDAPANSPFSLTASPAVSGMVDYDGNDLNDTLSGFATSYANLNVTIIPVPEPLGLLAVAGLGLRAARWRANRSPLR